MKQHTMNLLGILGAFVVSLLIFTSHIIAADAAKPQPSPLEGIENAFHITKMTINPARCPLCGGPNECQSATQSDFDEPCWCMKETFPPGLLARVPEEARGCACICQCCLAAAQREK